MTNKIILITGATDGIGKITAKELAKQGHTVVIHGRNKTKTEAVCMEIKSETVNNNIDFLIADLFSLSDVKHMAEEFKDRYDHLDVLINNAGAIFNKVREITKDGFEKTIALNLFAPFLLTELLLDSLDKSPAARIINVSSEMHKRSGKPDFKDFQHEKNYSPTTAYGLSKLYLIWITRHLTAELNAKGFKNITANLAHPGAVATNFGQDSDKGFINNLIFKLALYMMPKPEKGAETSVYLATSPDVKNITGKYFGNKKINKTAEKYYSLENAKIVWDYCKNVTKKYI